jgi:hypothetical protein
MSLAICAGQAVVSGGLLRWAFRARTFMQNPDRSKGISRGFWGMTEEAPHVFHEIVFCVGLADRRGVRLWD